MRLGVTYRDLKDSLGEDYEKLRQNFTRNECSLFSGWVRKASRPVLSPDSDHADCLYAEVDSFDVS